MWTTLQPPGRLQGCHLVHECRVHASSQGYVSAEQAQVEVMTTSGQGVVCADGDDGGVATI